MILIVALLSIFFSLIWNIFFFSILTIHNHKPSMGSCEVPQICWTDRFSRFDVYRLKTNKHPKKQTSKVYIKNKDVKT